MSEQLMKAQEAVTATAPKPSVASRIGSIIKNPEGIAAIAMTSLAVLAGKTATAEAMDTQPVQPNVTTEITSVSISAASAEAQAAATDSARVVLAFHRANGTTKKEAKKMKDQCHTDYNGFWNSGTQVGESSENPAFFWDTRPAIICKSKNSPTGYKKVGIPKNKHVLRDGFQKHDVIPGTDCNNIAGGKKHKNVVVKPIVVRSFNETIEVDATAHAVADAQCAPGVSAHGEGNGHGYAKLTVKEILRSRGDAFANAKGEAKASASASASANARCEDIIGGGKKNLPPTVEVDNPNHIGTNDTIAFCERENDADGVIANRVFSIVNGGGNFVSVVYPGNDPGEYCRDYHAPSSSTSTTGNEIVLSAEVWDNSGDNATNQTNPFPVVELPQ